MIEVHKINKNNVTGSEIFSSDEILFLILFYHLTDSEQLDLLAYLQNKIAVDSKINIKQVK